MFETSAKVLTRLAKAFDDCEKNEAAGAIPIFRSLFEPSILAGSEFRPPSYSTSR
jgi:hypothetical protein